MGKQIKILDLLKNIAKFFNYNFSDLKIKEVGLRKGEKIKENLSYDKLLKTKIKNIFTAQDPVYTKNHVTKNYNIIKNSIENLNLKECIRLLKKFK